MKQFNDDLGGTIRMTPASTNHSLGCCTGLSSSVPAAQLCRSAGLFQTGYCTPAHMCLLKHCSTVHGGGGEEVSLQLQMGTTPIVFQSPFQGPRSAHTFTGE